LTGDERDLRPNAARHLLTLLLYLVLSILWFGRALFRGLGASHLGPTVDSSFLMWALVWWPHALRHGLNPFLCRLIWAPQGFNLAWSAGIPLASLVAAPLTLSAGPVVSYNVLCLLAPALAAWCAYILCYKLAGSYYPALLGGYLFGFSSYMLGQLAGGHLNLLLIFPVPVIVLIVLAGWTGAIAPAWFAGSLAIVLVVQFLCSIEVAATTVVFGAIVLMIAWWVGAPPDRTRLLKLLPPLAAAGILALILLSPYLYYLLLPGAPHGAINSPGGYSADFANLVVPTRTMQLGTLPALQALARRFPGNVGERDAYVGLPLLLVILHFGWRRRHEPSAQLLVAAFSIILICALGPRLRVAGWSGFGLPWKLAMHVPLLKSALPGRFMGYAFLVAALIAACWLADAELARGWRLAVAALILVGSLPNLNARTWAAPTNIPAFFAAGSFRHQLDAGQTAVVLPYGIEGESMLWQAVAGMWFRMAGGYTGITPREFEQWPVVRAFMTSSYIPNISLQLVAFMAAHGADVVVVDDANWHFWAPALAPLDGAPLNADGVWLYRTRPALLAPFRGAQALAWERCDAQARFALQIVAARNYLRAGRDPTLLSPLHAQQLGFLPPRMVRDPDVRTDNGLYLGPWTDGGIAVGVVGSYEALRPLIAEYRVHARQVFFPYPKELVEPPSGDTFLRLLVMVFSREVLIRDLLPPPAILSRPSSKLDVRPPSLCD
jgi:hypothetical protein